MKFNSILNESDPQLFLSSFSPAVALPMQQRARFRRRNKWISIYDSIFEASRTSQWLSDFRQTETSIETEIDTSVENYRKKFLFTLERCMTVKNTDNVYNNLFLID